MPDPLEIVSHTPIWVFAILALLVALGVMALRPREVSVWRLPVVPAVFIVWGVLTLLQRAMGAPILALDWVVAAAIGGAIGWTTTRLDGARFDRAAGRVKLPGSALPLARNLIVFLAKYGLAVAAAVVPAEAARLAWWDVTVSGLAAGYFLGWLGRVFAAYLKAPRATA